VTTSIKGIAWDHPRGYGPLRATSLLFAQQTGIEIDWDIRSLKDFGDKPIEDLIDEYDLITIDHPYMGQADKYGLLLALDTVLPKDVLQQLDSQSVGPSFRSYFYGNKLYALPIDAAALVAASRPDLLNQLGLELPRLRGELFEFYQRLPSEYWVAWPLCATDIWCSFLTLCAQDMGPGFIKDGQINLSAGVQAIDELKRQPSIT